MSEKLDIKTETETEAKSETKIEAEFCEEWIVQEVWALIFIVQQK